MSALPTRISKDQPARRRAAEVRDAGSMTVARPPPSGGSGRGFVGAEGRQAGAAAAAGAALSVPRGPEKPVELFRPTRAFPKRGPAMRDRVRRSPRGGRPCPARPPRRGDQNGGLRDGQRTVPESLPSAPVRRHSAPGHRRQPNAVPARTGSPWPICIPEPKLLNANDTLVTHVPQVTKGRVP